jgi:hypothetical protein
MFNVWKEEEWFVSLICVVEPSMESKGFLSPKGAEEKEEEQDYYRL